MKPDAFNPLQSGLGNFKTVNAPDTTEGDITYPSVSTTQGFGIDPSMIPDFHNDLDLPLQEDRRQVHAQFAENASKEQIRADAAMNEALALKSASMGIPSAAKNCLKELILKGEIQKEFRLFGHDWRLRGLDQSDLLNAMDDVSDSMTTSASRITAVTFSIVVYCIDAIDGVRVKDLFPDILPSLYKDNTIYLLALRRALRTYMIGMPPIVIDSLYEKYQEVSKERDVALAELKNS